MKTMYVPDEKAQHTSSRDRTGPTFKNPDDTGQEPLATSSEADWGVQPSRSCSLVNSAHVGTARPENPKAILLHASEALERVEEYVEQCMASLRYFVDLGSGNRPREFADIKRHLTHTRVLMNSSASILLIVRELAVGLRVLATKAAIRRAGIPEPNDQPPPLA